MEGFDSTHSGEDFENLFGKVDALTPYIAEFTVVDLRPALDGNRDIIITKGLVDAVKEGRTLIIKPDTGSTGGIIASSSYNKDFSYILIEFTTIELLPTTYKLYIETPVDATEYVLHGSDIHMVESQPQLRSGETIKTINGQSVLGEGDISINEPYLAPFSVQDLDRAIHGFDFRFLKDELVTAVVSGRPLVVPIHSVDTSGITSSYYITATENGKEIVIDIIHSSKVYHLTLEDISGQSFIVITFDNVSCKDLANTFVLPYTFEEISDAVKNKSKLYVDSDFVDAVNNKKLILIPTGKTIANGQYVVAHYVSGSLPNSDLNIRLKIQDPLVIRNKSLFIITFKAKSAAPAEADVFLEELLLLFESSLNDRLSVIYSGDSITVTGPNGEQTVNSIDGASFTNNGKVTAMTPNTVYNFVNNGVNRTIAVYDDHRLVITSENNSTVALSPAVTYTSRDRILPSALPSSLVTEPELRKALGNKVDKVEGKGLSTEDFTTLLKQKLESLQNYDDATISAAIAKLRNDFDTLVESDTSGAIDKFNEIIAFLDGIEDSQSLDNIIASIELQIAGKQSAITDLDTIREGAALGATALQEHQPIKTIFGQEIVGEGDVMDNYSMEITAAGTYTVESIINPRIIRGGNIFPLVVEKIVTINYGPTLNVRISSDGTLTVSGPIANIQTFYLASSSIPEEFMPKNVAKLDDIQQADFDETDVESKAYIKNRSHYFSPYVLGWTLIVNDATVGTNISDITDYFKLGGSVYKSADMLGVEFNCQKSGPPVFVTVVEELDSDGNPIFYLRHISGISGAGAPIMFFPAGTVKTIDSAFIPENFATKVYVETVIAEAITNVINASY